MKDFHEINTVLTDPVDSASCPKCSKMSSVQGLPIFSIIQCPHCSFEFQVPARFGGFMLLERLGAGGMGSVFRARDESLNREVAIKVMLKSLGDDPQFVETFQREAQAAAQLNHRHIAQIYSFGQEKGQPYIAMELVPGGSLDKMMEEQEIDPAAAILIGLQIAEGLSAAADLGMVHGDVKPENILFDTDKQAKLVDFGLAAMQGGPNGEIWGTPYYIAPEKVRRQKVDFRADIYSLGGTLYHAITGVPPFEGEDATAVVKARFDGPPKAMGEHCENVPPELEALIGRMLAVEPQTRYPTYGSLLGDMKRFLAKAGPVKLTKNSKRILIKGKHSSLEKRQSLAAKSGSLKVSTEQLGAQKESMPPVKPPTTSGVGSKVAVWVIMAILASASLLFFARRHQQYKKAERERRAIVTEQERARVNITRSQSNAKVLVERSEEIGKEAQQIAKNAVDEVVKALGEEARAKVEVEQSVQPAKAPKDTPAAASQEKAVAAQAGAIPEKVLKGEVPAEVVANIAKMLPADLAKDLKGLNTTDAEKLIAFMTKNVERIPPNKVLEIKELVAAGVPKVLEEVAKVVAEPEPAAGAEELSGEELIFAKVRSIQVGAAEVVQVCNQSKGLLQEVEQKTEAAENFDQITTEHAEGLVKLSNELVEQINRYTNSKEYTDLARKISQMRRTYDEVKVELVTLHEQKRVAQLNEERRLRAEAKAEEERLAHEAREQKIATELASVDEAEAANLTAVQQLSFKEVMRNLRTFRETLETPEAQNKATVAIDRVLRLSELHELMVKKVVGYRSARGWIVDDANMRNLIVGGRPITWIDVFSKRREIVAELINSVILGEENLRDLRLREKTTLMTNSALCLNTFYKGDASAMERAKTLANDAARQFEVDAPTIKALLPEFFE